MEIIAGHGKRKAGYGNTGSAFGRDFDAGRRFAGNDGRNMELYKGSGRRNLSGCAPGGSKGALYFRTSYKRTGGDGQAERAEGGGADV